MQLLDREGVLATAISEQPNVRSTRVASRDDGLKEIMRDTTIMMVDDAVSTLEVLQIFLEDAGYQHFLPVSHSPDTFQLLTETMPDVILLDINMPEVSGFDILSFMRTREEFQYTPVIILTSSNDAETKLQALQLGATDFLAKPVDESELLLRLRNTLTAKRYLDQQINYDQVTGLANRRLFIEKLQRSISWSERESRNSAVLLIDINRFKKINDSLGHSVGDELLRQTGLRLDSVVRSNEKVRRTDTTSPNDCLARIGGDEFAVLLTDVEGVETTAGIAERLLDELAQSFRIQNHELFVTASIGIALCPENGEDAETLLRHADIAMSHAKRSGRNHPCVYTRELDKRANHLLTLESELHKALERDEFVLHFQPKVDVRTGFVVGAETLVRWLHPVRGMVPPGEFIAVAEEAGLIGAIGNRVLREASRQYATWRTEGLTDLQLSVNVSGHQFRSREFLHDVRRTLEETGMVPDRLTLELTESVVIEDAKENIDVLYALKETGVKLSVDDFGTGYSSLSYLDQFPLDELKVDRAFVNQISSTGDEAPIVSAILAMARSLRFMVVAEGVEYEHQLEYLRANGCSQYQGFLFSKPLPAEAFVKIATRWKPGPR